MQLTRSRMFSSLALSAALALGAAADAAPSAKQYHFDLGSITTKPAVKADVAKVAVPRIEAEVKKAFAEHPQLAKMDGAPNPKESAEAYRSYLSKHRIAGAYHVTVEIAEATEKLTPVKDKADTQILEVHLTLRMLGEHIPDDTIGFNGRGNTTIKQEVPLKVAAKDREDTWHDAAEIVVADAMKTAFEELAAAKPKK
jgi:hypothetical protein